MLLNIFQAKDLNIKNNVKYTQGYLSGFNNIFLHGYKLKNRSPYIVFNRHWDINFEF